MPNTKYYFVLASQQFLISQEPLEEVLRERIQYYCRTNKKIDFWLLPSPKFLDSEKKVKRYIFIIIKVKLINLYCAHNYKLMSIRSTVLYIRPRS